MRREYKNIHEEAFCNWIEEKGYTAMKRGWPDFFCRNKAGDIICVEVKPRPGVYLKVEQYIVMEALSKFGVKCYRWDPVNKHLQDIKFHPYRTPTYRLNKNIAIGDLIVIRDRAT